MTFGGGVVRPKLNIGLAIAGSAAFSISTMFSSMKPLLISSLVEQTGYSVTFAGFVAAMPFAGGVLSAFLMPWLYRRLSIGAALTGFGMALALVEAANSMWFAIPALILTGQLAAGICGGVLMGYVSQLIAVSGRSEQTFGLVDTVGVALMSLMIAVIGGAIGSDGLHGGFLAAAFFSAIFGLAMHISRSGLPSLPRPIVNEIASRLHVSWLAVVTIAMGVIFVTFSGLGFAFMITAARGLGFSYAAASSTIGIILLLTATGSFVGGWCASRFGAKWPLLYAFALCAVGWHVVFHTHSRLMFLLALGPAIFALQFSFPILLALAGALDGDGRFAAIAAPLIVSGFAWAAIIAGVVVQHWGLASLSVVTAIGMVLCTALLLVSARQPDRRVLV